VRDFRNKNVGKCAVENQEWFIVFKVVVTIVTEFIIDLFIRNEVDVNMTLKQRTRFIFFHHELQKAGCYRNCANLYILSKF